MNEKEHKLLNFILSDLFNAPTDDDILQVDKNGSLWDGERKLSEAETQSIIAEAQTIQRLELTKILMREMKHIGFKKLGIESRNWEEVFFGKAMIYWQDVFEKKIDGLANLKVKSPIKE